MRSTEELKARIRYLPGSTVHRLLPDAQRQIGLVEGAYRAVREGRAETPATPEIAPRPGAFVHAMPAYLADGDITSVKWISGYATNRERGLPYLSGLIVVNDSETGLPVAIMDCSPITAARTAAASAVCIATFARPGWSRVGIIGYGAQARAHVAALVKLRQSVTIRVYSRRSLTTRDGSVSFVAAARDAVDGSDVVITGMPLEISLEPPVAFDWLAPNTLVLPLDDDASLDASVVTNADAFYVDDLVDYRMRRAGGRFVGWREPDGVTAHAVVGSPPSRGVIVCANQGMGVLDAVFAGFVLEAAEREQAGILVDR